MGGNEIRVQLLGGFSISIGAQEVTTKSFHHRNMALKETHPSRWRHYLEKLIEDRTKTAGTWRAAALHFLTIAHVFEGEDSTVLVHQLEVLAANGGAAYRANLKAGLGYHLLASDPSGSTRAFEEAMEISERHGLEFGQMGPTRESSSPPRALRNRAKR